MTRLLALLALLTLCGCAEPHAWRAFGYEARWWPDCATCVLRVERCEDCGQWRYQEE